MSDQAAFWDERFSGDGFAFGTEPNAFLVSQAHYLKPGLRALVPGDGEGRNGVWLAQQGLIVDSVDVSPAGVAKAQKLAAERGVEVHAQIGDLTIWCWPENVYDIVASLYLHFFDGERPLMHQAMLNALKPGGILILEAFSLQQLEMKKHHHSGGPKTPDMLYSKEKLVSDFAGSSIIMLEEADTELNEGHRHKGRASVVRAIVRREARG